MCVIGYSDEEKEMGNETPAYTPFKTPATSTQPVAAMRKNRFFSSPFSFFLRIQKCIHVQNICTQKSVACTQYPPLFCRPPERVGESEINSGRKARARVSAVKYRSTIRVHQK